MQGELINVTLFYSLWRAITSMRTLRPRPQIPLRQENWPQRAHLGYIFNSSKGTVKKGVWDAHEVPGLSKKLRLAVVARDQTPTPQWRFWGFPTGANVCPRQLKPWVALSQDLLLWASFLDQAARSFITHAHLGSFFINLHEDSGSGSLCPEPAFRDQCLRIIKTRWLIRNALRCYCFVCWIQLNQIQHWVCGVGVKILKNKTLGSNIPNYIDIINTFPMEICDPLHFQRKAFTFLNDPLCE